MELIIFYIIISYIIYTGMIVNEYVNSTHVPTVVKISWLFSPISILVILGIAISDILNYLKHESNK